ncbi:MAG: hypothetical protein Q7R69_02240 [bacterium]|nr:hypothetical protein [bacterium]
MKSWFLGRFRLYDDVLAFINDNKLAPGEFVVLKVSPGIPDQQAWQERPEICIMYYAEKVLV